VTVTFLYPTGANPTHRVEAEVYMFCEVEIVTAWEIAGVELDDHDLFAFLTMHGAKACARALDEAVALDAAEDAHRLARAQERALVCP
jgi:hypothetical protein